jgi:CRISPR-associated protein Csb1
MRLLDPVGRVSSLEVPHRIADAILRDSLLDGARFRDTEVGKRIGMVSLRDATALFEFCPTALVFGMWDSTGPKGGLGAKFERAMVAEIVGIDAVYGVKTSSRIDPLGIQLRAGPLYKAADDAGWTLDESRAKREKGKAVTLGKDGRPSEANHGNVTPAFAKYTKGAEGRDPFADQEADQRYDFRTSDGDIDISARVRLTERSAREGRIAPGGVTISHAEQTIVLSLPALRRLRFPLKGKVSPDIDNAARTVLAALGLCAAALAAENGLDLRSRCLLWPTGPLEWQMLGKPGDVHDVSLDADGAISLVKEAVDKARDLGLTWREDPVVLKPSDDLVKLVVKSQQLAAQQGGDAGEGGA